jgi:hypothetical protein
MRCYTCYLRVVGGIHLGVPESVGICTRCGAGVCIDHANRGHADVLLCPGCSVEQKKSDTRTLETRGAAGS